jgi:Protein of unknown function (DUF551)
MEWQLIETAPKDDLEHVLLFGDGVSFTKCVFVGYWDEMIQEWILFDSVNFVVPTHWMHLPEAPNVE